MPRGNDLGTVEGGTNKQDQRGLRFVNLRFADFFDVFLAVFFADLLDADLADFLAAVFFADTAFPLLADFLVFFFGAVV